MKKNQIVLKRKGTEKEKSNKEQKI